MSIITRCRVHDAIYWKKTGKMADGTVTYAAPVQIKCRWDESESVAITLTNGETFMSRASVICDRHVSVDDMFMRGALTSIPEGRNKNIPQDLPNAFICKQVDIITKLRNSNFNDMDKTLVTAFLT